MIEQYLWNAVKNRVWLSFIVILIGNSASAQVRIGPDNTVAVNTAAMLEVASSATTLKGFLSPLVSLTSAYTWGLLGTSSDGMMVYNTNASLISGAGAGYYLYYNSRWNKIFDNTTSLPRALVTSSISEGPFTANANTAITHNATDASNNGVTISADGVQFIIQSTGYYLITANIRMMDDGTTTAPLGLRAFSIVKNCTYDASYNCTGGVVLGNTIMTSIGKSSLNAGAMCLLQAGDTVLSYFMTNISNTTLNSDNISMQIVKCSN